MKTYILSLFVLLAFSLISNKAGAQSNTITIRGNVVESKNQKPVEFATVMVANPETGTSITGVTTDLDGNFVVKTEAPSFYLEVSFIGFEKKEIREFDIVNNEINLGTIVLAENSEMLEEVVVRAEKSSTEFKLDKRVFNVGKDLSTTGASALEVLNNVPSVNVDIEGQISLRGSTGVQILINGKPSVIASEQGNTLGTITADMIESIEVITNPSAKYEAEGTSGIINIIIKKEEREGLNGSITLNTGVPDNHSIGLSLNRRTDKFNLFSQLGVGYRSSPRESKNINQNLTTGESLISEGTEYRDETFFNLILGTDYHINETNIVTLSGSYAYEIEDQPSRTDFLIPDENGIPVSEWYREEKTEATNPKWQYELQYKKDFKGHKDHDLLFSALGHFFGKDQSSEFSNNDILGNEAGGNQQTRTNFQEAKYTFSTDYKRPINDKFTIETGAQYVLNAVSNDFAVSDLVNEEWVPNPAFTNVFEYDQNVFGLYGTGSYEGEKWGIKVGLRAENTVLKTYLVNTGERNNQNFTNLFPTLHTSYKISPTVSLQAGYSRRIYRPRLWDLNPFFNIRNNFSIRTGNPDLLPEFTDSYELTSIYLLNKVTLNVGAYYRKTNDVIERVSFFEDNVSTTRPVNIGTNDAIGIEVNGKYDVAKWWTINGDLNYNYFSRLGMLEGTSFDFSADQFTSKLTTKFKLPLDFEVEITGQFQSRYKTVQSEVSQNLFADLGARKKIFKGKGVISLSVRDIFASRIREVETFQQDFYLYNWDRRGRFVRLGFSYGFGKGEAMEYTARRHY
ncbi:MAG: TonB-dependent receptor [Saprospiraceae bacterium]|nr:TonB-dependent receptor [Saprospiraceae bacterium]